MIGAWTFWQWPHIWGPHWCPYGEYCFNSQVPLLSNFVLSYSRWTYLGYAQVLYEECSQVKAKNRSQQISAFISTFQVLRFLWLIIMGHTCQLPPFSFFLQSLIDTFAEHCSHIFQASGQHWGFQGDRSELWFWSLSIVIDALKSKSGYSCDRPRQLCWCPTCERKKHWEGEIFHGFNCPNHRYTSTFKFRFTRWRWWRRLGKTSPPSIARRGTSWQGLQVHGTPSWTMPSRQRPPHTWS